MSGPKTYVIHDVDEVTLRRFGLYPHAHVARLAAIVRALAASDDPFDHGMLCSMCGAEPAEGHATACPWALARAWVAEQEENGR